MSSSSSEGERVVDAGTPERPPVGRLGSLLEIWRARERRLQEERGAERGRRVRERVAEAHRRSSSRDGHIHAILR